MTAGRKLVISKEQLQSLVDAGLSARQIGQELGLHYQTIYFRMKRLGVDTKPKQIVTDKQIAEVIARYERRAAAE